MAEQNTRCLWRWVAGIEGGLIVALIVGSITIVPRAEFFAFEKEARAEIKALREEIAMEVKSVNSRLARIEALLEKR